MFNDEELKRFDDECYTWENIIVWLQKNNKTNIPGCIAFLLKREFELGYIKSIESAIIACKQNCKEYAKYAKEVEKYLMLI